MAAASRKLYAVMLVGGERVPVLCAMRDCDAFASTADVVKGEVIYRCAEHARDRMV